MISPTADFREQQGFVSHPDKGAAHETLMQQFNQDVVFLKQLSRHEDRCDLKRDTLLPRYRPAVQRYLDSGKCYANALFVQCIIWLFDTEQFDDALDWVEIAIKQHQPSPFRRPLSVFAADTIYQWAERQLTSSKPIDPYFARVLAHMHRDWRLPEALSAKYYKLAGLHVLKQAAANGQPSHVHDTGVLNVAMKLLEKAQQEHTKIGVKNLINRIQMRLRALAQ